MGLSSRYALLLACVIGAATAADESEVRAATQAHLVALDRIEPGGDRDDLRFLDALVGDARVVSLGEGTHFGHEFLAFRNRLFEYLVEELGFTAIAAETDFVDGTAIDDYVTRGGELTTELVAGVFSFGAPEAAAENRQLLQWMRRHNARPDLRRKIRFYGLEMMGRNLGHAQPIVDRPLDTALRYVTTVAPEQAQLFSARVRPALQVLTSRPYSSSSGKRPPYFELTVQQRDAFTVAIADLAALFEQRQVEWVEKTSVLAYERAYRSVLNARSLDADFRADGWWSGCSQGRRSCTRDQRDATSARNLLWALEQEGPEGRILVFAHDAHVRKGPVRHVDPSKQFTSLGQHLNASLGSQVRVIGTLSDAAPEQAGLDLWYDGVSAMMRNQSHAGVVLNLRTLPPGGAHSWWNNSIGSTQGIAFDPAECFDALVHFPTLTPWHRE